MDRLNEAEELHVKQMLPNIEVSGVVRAERRRSDPKGHGAFCIFGCENIFRAECFIGSRSVLYLWV